MLGPKRKPSLRRLASLFILFFGAISATANASVETHASGRYYQFQEQPIFILGHYAWASVDPNTFIDHPSTYRKMIDDAAEYGLNYIRLSLSINRFTATTDPASYDGQPTPIAFGVINGKADLDQWDEIFWNGLDETIAYAQSRNILVHVAVFDGVDIRRGNKAYRWPNSHWNENNQTKSFFGYLDYDGNGTIDKLGEFYQLDGFINPDANGTNDQRLGYYQKRLIEKAIAVADKYDNVFFQVGNELIGADTPWNEAAVDFFKSLSSRLVTVNDVKSDSPMSSNADGFSQHNPSDTPADIKSSVTAIVGKGYPAWMDPDGGQLMYDSPEENRISAWYSLTGGAAGWGGFNRTYLENNNQGVAALLTYYKNLSTFLSRTEVPFWQMLPTQTSISNPEMNNLLTQSGEHYLAYIRQDSLVEIDLEPATYDVISYDPVSGAFSNNALVAAEGITTFTRPTFAKEDWVLYLQRATEIPNILPEVTLTSPLANSIHRQNSAIELAANASDSDGTITAVEFYKEDGLIASVTAPPFIYSWNNASIGNHTLRAIAYDDRDASAESGLVSITVEAPNIPPTATIDTPLNNSIYPTGATVEFKATASDSDGSISKVEYYSNDKLIVSLTEAPYNFTAVDAPEGIYDVTLIAYDNAGASTKSDVITVTVKSETINMPPSVNITAPQDNEVYTVGTEVFIQATATDSDGTITKVEFYAEDTLLTADTTAPYNYQWTPKITGNYRLKAIAYDDSNAASISSSLMITIEDAVTTPVDTTPPTVPDNLQTTLVNASTISLTWGSATDTESGLLGYRIYRDDRLISTTSDTNYKDSNLDANTLYEYSITAVDGSPAENESDPATLSVRTDTKRVCFFFICW